MCVGAEVGLNEGEYEGEPDTEETNTGDGCAVWDTEGEKV